MSAFIFSDEEVKQKEENTIIKYSYSSDKIMKNFKNQFSSYIKVTKRTEYLSCKMVKNCKEKSR